MEGRRQVLNPSNCTGVWFTINGPRVGWCRQVRIHTDPKTREERKEVVGASNGLAVGTALARGERVRWLKMAISIKAASVPRVDSLDEEEQLILENPEEEVLGDDGMPLTMVRRSLKDARQ